jgi:S1-C subfamily serine protease
VPIGLSSASVVLDASSPSVRVRVLASEPTTVACSTTAGWLAVSPASLHAPGEIEVRASPRGLPAGEHTAQVLLLAAGARTPIPLGVTLRQGKSEPEGAQAGAPPVAPGKAAPAAPAAPPEAKPPAPAKPPELPYGQRAISPDALEAVKAATVLIEATYRPIGSDPGRVSAKEHATWDGSGFVVHPSGLIVTNDHVVEALQTLPGEGATEGRRALTTRTFVLQTVSVRTGSGLASARLDPAQVLVTYPFPRDLALIRVTPDAPLTAIHGLDPANRTTLNTMAAVTDRVWAVGFPRGESMESELAGYGMSKNPHGPDVSVREGRITALRKNDVGAVKAVEHSCNIEHGNSGGPLVDSNGMLVGVNSLGTTKTAFAIPLATVLDSFFDTLACHGYGNLFETASDRVLTVDPSAAGNDPPDDAPGKALTYRSLPRALQAARNGDVVRLVAGEFPLDAVLPIRTGVRVVGAGAGRTVLRARGKDGKGFEGYAVVMGGRRYVEVSDLSIVNPGGKGLWFQDDSGREQYLHDVEIRATRWALGFGKRTHARVTNCDLHGDVWVAGKDAQPVLERVGVHAGSEAIFSVGAVTVRDGAAPTLLGCRIAAERDGVVLSNGARATLRGCEIAAGGGVGIRVLGGGATLHACWVFGAHGPAVLVRDGAQVELTDTRLRAIHDPGLRVRDPETTATVSGCVVESQSVGFLVEKGAHATFDGNAVPYESGRKTDTLDWADAPTILPVPAAAAATPVFPSEQARRAWEAKARRAAMERPFGLVVADSGSHAEIRGNLLATDHGGSAVRVDPGGDLVDRGGNETPGADYPLYRADKRWFSGD